MTTCADGVLDRTTNVEVFSDFYSADLTLQSRLVADAAPSHPQQGMVTITTIQRVFYAELLTTHSLESFYCTDSVTFPTPGTSLRFDAALRPTHVVGYLTPLIPGLCLTGTLLWPYDGPVMEPQQSPSTPGLGIVGLWPQASDIQLMPVPAPAGCPSLQGSALASPHADTAYGLHLPSPSPPASPTNVSTPGSSGASTSTSPERHTEATPLPRERRLRSAPYTRPTTSDHRSNQSSPMDPMGAAALDRVKKRVQQLIKAHPHAIEPCIGDPAANAIIGSTPLRLGTPGKSIYTMFFYSSRSGNRLRFNCRICVHVDARFSRALRHQRQDHFDHSPFQCQGGTGHPSW